MHEFNAFYNFLGTGSGGQATTTPTGVVTNPPTAAPTGLITEQ